MNRPDYDWRSAANFRIAQRSQAAGDYRGARTLYAQVIEEHRGHVAARHNAAVLEIRCGHPEIALEHLAVLEDELDAAGASMPRAQDPASRATHPLVYSLIYNRALAHATMASGHDSKDADLRAAYDETRRLVTDVLTRLQDLRALGPARDLAAPERAERAVLRPLEPVSVMFHASMRIEVDADAFAYALANPVDASQLRAPKDRSDQRAELLGRLKDRQWPVLAQRFAEVSASPRARYNVALYLTRLHRHAPPQTGDSPFSIRARANLRYALQDQELHAWALIDPALEPLRAKDIADEWDALIAEFESPIAPEPVMNVAATVDLSTPAPEPARWRFTVLTEPIAWQLLAGDEVVAVASRVFPGLAQAFEAAARVKEEAPDAALNTPWKGQRSAWRFDFQRRRGTHTWRLYADDGEEVARGGRSFDLLSDAVRAAELVRENVERARLQLDAGDAAPD